MSADDAVTLRTHLETRLTEIERSIAREVEVLRTLLATHAAAHAREHEMSSEIRTVLLHTVEHRIEEVQAGMLAQFAQIQLAVDKAERNQVEKFSSVNEFRAVLTDQAATFVRRDFIDQVKDTLEKNMEAMEGQLRAEIEKGRLKTDELERERRYLEGRIYGISIAVGVVVTIVTIAIRFLPFGG